MRWLDVCGPPGVGKSTICDDIWGPHDVPIEDRLPPLVWHDFINEITRLFYVIRKHETIGAAVRMNNRSLRKIATVWRMDQEPFHVPYYIQTALIQRGLGFAWRMVDLDISVEKELYHYFRLMPTSLGAVFLDAPSDVVKQRNYDRGKNPETAHEVRAHMVDGMRDGIDLAKSVLNDRGLPILELSTEEDIGKCRERVLNFAAHQAAHTKAIRRPSQDQIFSPPTFWIR